MTEPSYIRMTKHGKNHAVRGKFTACGLMLPMRPLGAGRERLCVQCRKILKREKLEVTP